MRGGVDSFVTMARALAGRARVVIVYIQEAHARDEWPILSARAAAPGREGVPVDYAQHASLDDRVAAAGDFVRHYSLPLDLLPVAADGMGNGFQDAYAAWPIRWYIFEHAPGSSSGSGGGAGGGRVIVRHIGQPDDASFDLTEPLRLLGM